MMTQPVILVLGARPDTLSHLHNCELKTGGEIVYVRDTEGVSTTFASHSISLLVVEDTNYNAALHELAPMLAADGIPLLLLFASDSMASVATLKDELPDVLVDFLVMPTEQQILQSRVELLLLFSEKNRLLQDREHELSDKSLELEVLRAEVAEKNEMLEALSSRDSLTGLFNRKYFEDNLAKEWKHGMRSSSSLSLLLIEVDHFQAYNTCYGPLEGDDCLRQVGLALYEALLRPVDIIARYDGEKFAAMLPDTDSSGAQLVAGRMSKNIKEMALEHELAASGGMVTVSIGASVIIPGKGGDHMSLIGSAYESLKEAKSAGGNCCRIDLAGAEL